MLCLPSPCVSQVAGIYMGTRLIVNISQVYTPLYLVESLKLAKVRVWLYCAMWEGGEGT